MKRYAPIVAAFVLAVFAAQCLAAPPLFKKKKYFGPIPAGPAPDRQPTPPLLPSKAPAPSGSGYLAGSTRTVRRSTAKE